MYTPLDRMPYLPITDRPRIKWPNDARVAFWVAPNVEHYEYLPTFDGKRNPWPRTPYPDVQNYSYFDYGNRVGFWRMLQVLDAHQVRCTVSLSLSVLYHFPEIADAMLSRDWDFMSHGFYNTEYMTTFDEARERAFLEDNIGTGDHSVCLVAEPRLPHRRNAPRTYSPNTGFSTTAISCTTISRCRCG